VQAGLLLASPQQPAAAPDGLKKVTQAALGGGFDLVVFARPDLLDHDSIRHPLVRVLRSKHPNEVCLPDGQHWEGGFNHRFAICKRAQAIQAYGNRIDMALDFCRSRGAPLHAENLLKHELKINNIPVSTMTVKASRVRFDGALKNEVFWSSCGRLGKIQRWLLPYRPPGHRPHAP
jgi:hypothetical protein